MINVFYLEMDIFAGHQVFFWRYLPPAAETLQTEMKDHEVIEILITHDFYPQQCAFEMARPSHQTRCVRRGSEVMKSLSERSLRRKTTIRSRCILRML